MPILKTKNFGPVSYDVDAVLAFPHGLPGFEDRQRFLALHFTDTDPLVFLQSMEDPNLCFLTMPVLAADPDYRLRVERDDCELIGLASETPRIGEDVLCLTVLSVREDGPTANLLAPIVVNLRTRKSVQAVVPQSGYSHQQPLVARERVTCS